jgi:hypothetical protein
MGKFFLTLIVFITITMVSLDAKPPKLPKPKKDGEWVEPAKPVAPKIFLEVGSGLKRIAAVYDMEFPHRKVRLII